MLPIVNPYRSAGDHTGGVDAHFKHKPKKTSGFCSRTSLLLVLVGLTCATYYLHMKYFSNIQRKPSVRGASHIYRSFSDSVKDFAADMKHDLTVLDEKKNPNPTDTAAVVDMRKPIDPKIQRSSKVNTLISTEQKDYQGKNEEQGEQNPVPIKQISSRADRIPLEMLNRIHEESSNANAVEDKVILLAAKAREAVHRPVTFKQEPPPPAQEQSQQEEQRNQKEETKQIHQHSEHVREQTELTKLQAEQQQLHRQDQERLKQQLPEVMPEAAKGIPPTLPVPVLQTEELETSTVKNTASVDAARAPPTKEPKVDSGRVPELPAEVAAEPPKLEEKREVQPPSTPVDQVPEEEPNALSALRDQELKQVALPQVPELAVPAELSHNITTTAAVATTIVVGEAAEKATAKALGLSLETTHKDTLPTTTDALHLPEKLTPPIEEHQLEAPMHLQNSKVPPVAAVNTIETENPPSIATTTTTTAIDQPSSFDLPENLKSSLRAVGGNQPASSVGNQGKVDYCAGNVDPFEQIPVDTFQPPSTADFELATQWRSAVRTMVNKISKLKYGGEGLREQIRSEVEALRIMRFQMFCKYA